MDVSLTKKSKGTKIIVNANGSPARVKLIQDTFDASFGFNFLERLIGAPRHTIRSSQLMLREDLAAFGLTQAVMAQRASRLQPVLARLLTLNYHGHTGYR